MKQRTFVECLRYNIKHNWNEGSLFESMTKDDCIKACDKIEQLEKALRDISNAEDELKAKGVGYNITVDVIAKIALGDCLGRCNCSKCRREQKINEELAKLRKENKRLKKNS